MSRRKLVWDDKVEDKSIDNKSKINKSKNKYNGVIGIDLGTTNCVLSYLDDKGNLEYYKDENDKATIPSFIELLGDNTYVIGNKAKEDLEKTKNKVLYSFKPDIGTEKILHKAEGIKYTAQFCETLMLDYIADKARDIMGIDKKEPLDAVITVPAYFDENKKFDTKMAAKMANLNVIRLLEEPSSSAIYTLTQKGMQIDGKMVVVYDLGGGTFDVSLVQLFSESASVINIGGDAKLGGDDYDRAIEELILKKYPEISEKVDINDQKVRDILKATSEKLKIDISNQYNQGIDKNDITGIENMVLFVDEVPEIFNISLHYDEVYECTEELTNRTINILHDVIEDYGLSLDDIDNVIMTGGSSNLPFVKEALTDYINENVEDDEKLEQLINDVKEFIINPDLSVGLGAGTYAKIIVDGDEDSRITNIVTHNFGIEESGGTMKVLIPKGRDIYRRVVQMQKFIPDRDNANEIKINVFEGEDVIAQNNSLIKTIIIPIPENTKREDFPCDVSFTLTKDKVLTISVQHPNGVEREKVQVDSKNNITNSEETYKTIKTLDNRSDLDE